LQSHFKEKNFKNKNKIGVTKWGKKNMQMDILLDYFQTICIAWMGCGAIQF
jgi:hypothetical protein